MPATILPVIECQLSSWQDVKTVQHMEQVNLKKYRVTSVEDALAVLEEAGESMVLLY